MKRKLLKEQSVYNISFKELQDIHDELSKDYTDIEINPELDWSGCYYSGDTPSIQLSWYGIPKNDGKTKKK